MAWRRIGDMQVIIWTNADPIDWRIYAALGEYYLRAARLWCSDYQYVTIRYNVLHF